MIVIGVTGFRRCGKNSTTDVLVERFGFTRYAFADALRTMAEAINPVISFEGIRPTLDAEIRGALGWRAEYRYKDILDAVGYERAKDVPDLRQFLQRLGTEGVRNVFGSHAWINALQHRIAQDKAERVCISDVRFRNEADWCLRHSQGLLWRVVRPGWGGNDPHPSEAEIPHLPASREIVAESLDELERAVIDAAQVDLSRFSSG